MRIIQLTRGETYRTNVGLVNVAPTELHATVEIRQASGALIFRRTYAVEPYGFHQENDIIGTNSPGAYAIVSSNDPQAAFFTYASVVDNRSGDPVLILPPDGPFSTGDQAYIPAAAHAAGAAGTQWRTDLEVHNPGTTQAVFSIALLRRDQANLTPEEHSFSLSPGQSARYEDVLLGVFGFTGGAAVRVVPDSGEIMVASRTYNDLPGGTYGQFIPAVSARDSVPQGARADLIQLTRSPSTDDGFRTNLGFVNVTAIEVEVGVEMFSADGVRLGARRVVLRPFEHAQVTDIIGTVTDDEVIGGFATVRMGTPNGRFLAYASVVDNRSGDPIYVPAVLSPE